MKVVLILADKSSRPAAPPAADSSFAIADGACPACKRAPFRVHGRRIEIAADDRHWEAEAHCLDCCAEVGILRVGPVETIFGLTEDAAVLNGRARVY